MKEAQRKYYKTKVKQKTIVFTQKDLYLYEYAKTINFSKVVKEYLKQLMEGDKNE